MPLSLFARPALLGATLLGSAGLLAGCGSKPASPNGDAPTGEVLMHADFEHLTGWLTPAQEATLTTSEAHSGKYATKIDQNTSYSLNYNTTLGQLCQRRPTKLRLDAWVLVPSAEAGASLVTHLDNPPDPKPLLWDGFDVAKEAKAGTWTHVSRLITIPAGVTANTGLGIYLWRTNDKAAPTYLDDLTISRVE